MLSTRLKTNFFSGSACQKSVQSSILILFLEFLNVFYFMFPYNFDFISNDITFITCYCFMKAFSLIFIVVKVDFKTFGFTKVYID